MRSIRRAAAVAALGGALALGRVCAAQETNGSETAQQAAGGARQTPEPAVEDEIIVLGRIGALRHELEIAEDAMFDRFNQVVGDRRLEIHCRTEAKIDSHIPQRVCVSNSWRQENANIAQSLLGQVRGEIGAPPEQYYAEQLRVQQHLGEEMRRLAAQDPQLHDAIIRVGEAQNALAEQTGKPAEHSVSLEMQPGDTGLPFDAKRAYEVRVGKEPWNLALTERMFTLGSITGEVLDLRLKCDRGSKRIDYRPDVDWTLPHDWQSCSLQVDAKPGTTFAFYEFE
jgi:hypothetical protein